MPMINLPECIILSPGVAKIFQIRKVTRKLHEKLHEKFHERVARTGRMNELHERVTRKICIKQKKIVKKKKVLKKKL